MLNPSHRLLISTLIALAGLPLSAAIFPEQFDGFKRGSATALKPPDPALYEEFAAQEGERASFTPTGSGTEKNATPKTPFTAEVWRLRDSTGALALYEYLRPAGSPNSPVATLAAKTDNGLLVAYGNYVIQFIGYSPNVPELDAIYTSLPQIDLSPLPTLIGFLPKADVIPGSEKYILGPESLKRFEPRLSASLVAFHLSAEGQSARYRTPSGELQLTVFDYPTPSMARERQEAFLMQPGVLAKRLGPLVAIVVNPANAEDAQKLLSLVQYQSKLTWSETVKKNEASRLANLVLTGFLLAGLIGGASLLAGLWLGGFRAISKKLGWHHEPEALTVLHIGYDPTSKVQDK